MSGDGEPVSFVEHANQVRKRIPFAYWLVYDAVTAPFLGYGIAHSLWFMIPMSMLAFAAFFDINEAFVKWERRRIKHFDDEVLRTHALYGEAFSARMYADNPNISEETRRAYEWAEGQFARIGAGKVDERDLIR